jgi:hypothetical protein
MPEVDPFNWQHRLYALSAVIGGWSAEVSNPIGKIWGRNLNARHWPANYDASACEWVDLANADQREHNAAVAAQLGA